ncbi:DUF2867 domain-containing protein [Bradyrhizobium sp.]|uniref:DUF2867 domain-containing protein n=1 Tax=Bradyrhizobium sp. TaxID=376 RepID=UPI003C7190BB
MHVIECEVPSGSMITRDLTGNSCFQDSYRAPLAHPERGIADIFFAVFGYTPLWIKLMLVARNALAKLAGLEVPTIAEIMNPQLKAGYSVSHKIGPWPIFFLGDHEIVAGRNDKHIDFRVSVLRTVDGEAASVVVSTICTVHNLFGKIYLFLIGPFHRNGVQLLMSNAVLAKRI